MRVLFCVHRFLPELGGVPMVTDLVCRHLVRCGWQVEVAVAVSPPEASPAGDARLPYGVLRGLSILETRRRMRAADCVVLQHLSIRHLIPLWLTLTPSLTVMHMGLERWGFVGTVYSFLFGLHLRLARHTAAVSEALRRHAPGIRYVLPNPYNDALYDTDPALPAPARERLVFLGRVVTVKGLEFAIEALALLRARGHDCCLTVIGDGGSLPDMRALADHLGLHDHVTFAGEKQAAEIPGLLRAQGTLLIPSNYFEAFGVVALEALACGLDVVAFRRGGLPEAVGEAGLVCDENTAAGLARQVERILTDTALRAALHAAREPHLARFRADRSAERYREMIEQIVTGHR